MSEQFKEQGGIATMDPGRFRRWLTSKMMTKFCSEKAQLKNQENAERTRLKNGLPHRVEYFHQVDDGYSHLSIQLLKELTDRYDVELVCHLVSVEEGDNTPEPELLLSLSHYDAALIAPHYGLDFVIDKLPLNKESITMACSILANLSQTDFVDHGAEISQAFWQQDNKKLDSLAQELGQKNDHETKSLIAQGNARRTHLNHYSGAMFYYGGEWYWGVDRFYHLEQRLAKLGLDTKKSSALIAPRPSLKNEARVNTKNLTLEIYPSLRSPYTAVVFDQTVRLAETTGVQLNAYPVLPMVMRGVPATIEKGRYILFDAGREARAAGVPFGPCADPIGEPSRRAYSLCQWAEQQGKLIEFISAFLRCAWVDGIDTNKASGLKQAVTTAGLDWNEAQQHLGSTAWQQQVEENRLKMYQAGLWGVPSFRLLNETGEPLLNVWGQDRLWLVERFILDNT